MRKCWYYQLGKILPSTMYKNKQLKLRLFLVEGNIFGDLLFLHLVESNIFLVEVPSKFHKNVYKYYININFIFKNNKEI